MAPKDEKSLVDRLRTYQRSNQANKRCADCPERGPTYVCLDFQIFVCQTCSGLHREFGHKIKSLSFSEWSAAEVAKMEEGGNEAARQKWLDRWNQEAFPEPDGSDLEAVREFIRLKYVEKKWFRPHGKPAAEKAKEAAAAAAKVEAAPAAPVKASAPLDLLSGGDEPPKVAPAPRAAANVAQAPDLLGAFDSPSTQEWTADFSAALPAPKATPKAPGDLEGLIDLDFSAPPKAAPKVPQEVLDTIKTHVEEPAAEPAPTDVEAQDAMSLGEKLRQAVLSGSQDDLKRLFDQCSKAPPKKAVDERRLAAFSAFDDLLKPSEEVVAAAGDSGYPGAEPRPVPSENQEPVETANGAGPQMFFIGDDAQVEDLLGSASASAPSSTPAPAPAPTPTSASRMPAGLQSLANNLTPHQLEQMSPQDLVQLQAMISSALQARAPPAAPVAAPGPSPAAWQATAYRPPSHRIDSFDMMQEQPESAAPFGELLDMFQKKNTV